MIYEDRVILDNPATQYFHQPITPDNLASHPKNPSICKFMIQLARFDELGSGVINIHKSIVAADKDIREMTKKHNEFLKELGLPQLP